MIKVTQDFYYSEWKYSPKKKKNAYLKSKIKSQHFLIGNRRVKNCKKKARTR